MNRIKNISVTSIPFIFLIVIGLWEGKITYYQQVFNSFLIFCFDAALLAVYFLYILRGKNGLKKEKKYILYFLAYLLFILYQFIISYISGEISYDRQYYLANYTFLILFSLFFYLYINDLEELRRSLLFLNIFFIIVVLWSVISVIYGRDVSTLKSLLHLIANSRLKLSFGNVNFYAGYAIGIFPLAFFSSFLWYDTKKKLISNRLSIALFAASMLGIIAIYFTQTRAAYLGWYAGFFIMGLGSLLLMAEKIPQKLRIIIVACFISISLIAPLLILSNPPQLINRYFPRIVRAFNDFDYTLNIRYTGWSGGLGLFQEHPVFGAGLGTVYPASFQYIDKLFYLYLPSHSFKHSHSEYVEVLGEAGVFGILVFTALFGYIVVSMMRRVYSSKYIFNYRILCLGVGSGVISMLVHQIFSLTLRMSITMSAYFFLLGTGIFLISYSGQALIPGACGPEKRSFFNGKFDLKEGYLLTGIIAALLLTAFFIFIPLYKSSRNLQNAKIETGSIVQKAIYLRNAIFLNKDNVYAYTELWKLLGKDMLINRKGKTYNAEFFDKIEKTLDSINRIIPGYQDVWSKYSVLYVFKHDYYSNILAKTGNNDYYKKAADSLNSIIKYSKLSINMNFLKLDTHLWRLLALREKHDEEKYFEALKDYITAKIYLDFARNNRILKENIAVSFAGGTEYMKQGDVHVFTISNMDVNIVMAACYPIIGLPRFNQLQQVLDVEVNKLLKRILQ